MKITRKQLRKLILESMIRPTPFDHKVDDLIDTGEIENIRSADELQSSITGDDIPYSEQIYHYEKPFMQNPDFINYLKEMMEGFLYLNKDVFIGAIQDSNSFDELIEDYFHAPDFLEMVITYSDFHGHDFAGGAKHSFGSPGRSGRIEPVIKDIFREVMLPHWNDWRGHFGLPL